MPDFVYCLNAVQQSETSISFVLVALHALCAMSGNAIFHMAREATYQVIDVPVSERRHVLRNLRLMGITA